MFYSSRYLFFFFFNDTATTEIYTLSLHDALPICTWSRPRERSAARELGTGTSTAAHRPVAVSRAPTDSASAVPSGDRKSTRLNSSHANISYAVFCLKKKKKKQSISQKKK